MGVDEETTQTRRILVLAMNELALVVLHK